MASARSTDVIDVSSESLLIICPACAWREIGTEEAALRRGLLAHLRFSHADDPIARKPRETQRRWFSRRGMVLA